MVDPTRRRAVQAPDRRRCGRRAGRTVAPRASAPGDPREGVPGRPNRCSAGRAGRRPFGHVPVRGRYRASDPSGDARHRALRRARRHGARRPRLVDLPRHADAAADRGGMGAGAELRAGRPPRLLAGQGHVRLDGVAGDELAHDGRDRGARAGPGRRRRDRRGARRSGPRLPVGGHRRRGPGDGAGHGDAGAGRHAGPGAPDRRPPDRPRGRARRLGRRGGLAAVRPERDHLAARLSCGDGGALGARREEGGGLGGLKERARTRER